MNYGVFIKLTADIMEIPCVGNNGVYIEEKGGRAGPFCAKKKMPAFVSRDVFFDIHIIVDTPLEVSHHSISDPVNSRTDLELIKTDQN